MQAQVSDVSSPAAEREAMPPHPVIEGYYQSESDRPAAVRSLFDASAPAYDRITGMMSFGTGARYRRDVLRRIGVSNGDHVLDVACGTGQVSAAARELVGDTGRVVGVDPSSEMRRVAEEQRGLDTVEGTAESLPFDDASFDFVTMGYALRHVRDLRVAFEEMQRVIKPGGVVCILEITPPRRRLSRQLIRFYLKSVVPMATRVVSRNREAARLMSYYWQTIEQCVPPTRIIDAMQQAGLANVERTITGGIFSEYTGTND